MRTMPGAAFPNGEIARKLQLVSAIFLGDFRRHLANPRRHLLFGEQDPF
jgi:hypothetical protein